jgi:putative Mg2+ transporter-C (MgtC) family protein
MNGQETVFFEIAGRLIAALAIGALIGIERTYQGRPAGFRTHALVCLASSVLMLVTVYETQWFPATGGSRAQIDPTRMSQGIMTGIGFLGAGAILKEGLTIRGLTTAASIWITAAIGILVGIGFYVPAGLAAALTLGTLSAFRWIESRMPVLLYYDFTLRSAESQSITEDQLRELVAEHGISIFRLSWRFRRGEGVAEFRMTIRTDSERRVQELNTRLKARTEVLEFRIVPIGH